MAKNPGRSTINTRIALEGGEAILAMLRDIGAKGEASFKQVKDGADTVGASGGRAADAIKRVEGAVTAASRSTDQLGKGLADISAGMKQLGVVAALVATQVTAVFGALAVFAKSGADAADTAGKAAQSLGLTVTEYGRLQFAAEQAGVSADEFGATISRLNAQIEKTKDATDRSSTALGKLGVTIIGNNGKLRPTEEILADIADKFQKLPDGAEKSATAIEIFGRSAGPRLIPLLNAGSAGIKALGDDAQALGLVFTELQTKVGEDMNDALSRLGRASKGVKDEIGLLFAPGIKDAADAFTEVIKENRGAIIELGQSVVTFAIPILKDLIAAISGRDQDIQGTFIFVATKGIQAFAAVVKSAFQEVVIPTFRELIGILNTILIPINAVFGTEITGQMVLVAALLIRVTGAYKLLTGAIALAAFAQTGLNAAVAASTLPAVGAFIAGFASQIRGIALAIGIFAGSFGGLGAAAGVLTGIGAALTSLPVVIGAVVFAIGAITLALLGIDWETVKTKAKAAWDFIAAGFRTANAALVADGGVTTGRLGELFNQFATNVMLNLDRIREVGIFQFLSEQVEKLKTIFSDLGTAIAASFSGWIDSVTARFTAMIELLTGGITSLITKFKELFTAQAAVEGGGNSQGGPPVPAFSRGGRVWGAGTSTSDSIPARLSAGEFVIKTAAVRHYGPRFFDLLNRMALARNGVRGFADGGLVDALRSGMGAVGATGFRMPPPGRLAGAGGGSERQSFDLVIDGQRFAGLSAPVDTAAELQKSAMRKRFSSAGRAPNWQGMR